jgi:hypothetical protein
MMMWRPDPHAVELADRTPASRNRYVDFLRAMSMLVVTVGHWLAAAPYFDTMGHLTTSHLSTVASGISGAAAGTMNACGRSGPWGCLTFRTRAYLTEHAHRIILQTPMILAQAASVFSPPYAA